MDKNFIRTLVIFILLNIFLYCFIIFFHSIVSFNSINYKYNAHHFIKDPRFDGRQFSFFNAIGQFDAQWYLKIAQTGYPYHPRLVDMNRKDSMDGLSYAFFPLYPMTLHAFNILIKNIELSGFVVSNILMILCFISLYFVVKGQFGEKIAGRTVFLIFAFPFSIFYRSYFTEGLLLLLLIWFAYFLIKKRWFLSSVLLGLLCVTRPTGLFLVPVLLLCFKKSKVSLIDGAKYLFVSLFPFLLWLAYCHLQTGNAFYFLAVRKEWFSGIPIVNNLLLIPYFFELSLHFFHGSKIDVLIAVIILLLLLKSRKTLRFELWMISFLLWLGPLLTTDMMSFSRYQAVSFPFFIYIAQKVKGVWYAVLLTLFLTGLLMISLFFVNWWWVG